MNECLRCGAAGMREHTHACMSAGRIPPSPRRYQTCPKCDGQKIVGKPPWIAGDQRSWTTADTGTFTCPVCLGLGMVEAPR